MFNIGATVWPGLSKLIEEAGEVTQVAGKIIALGGAETLHWDGSDLRERLSQELADLSAAIDFVVEQNGLDLTEFEARRDSKLVIFRHWQFKQRGL